MFLVIYNNYQLSIIVNGNIQLTPLTDSTLQLSWIPSSSNNVSFYHLSVLNIGNSTLYQWALRPDQSFEYILELG